MAEALINPLPPLRGSNIFISHVPGAHAPGFMLPPATPADDCLARHLSLVTRHFLLWRGRRMMRSIVIVLSFAVVAVASKRGVH